MQRQSITHNKCTNAADEILLRLTKAGILFSKRGPNGGYFLQVQFKDISVQQISSIVEILPDIKFELTPEANQLKLFIDKRIANITLDQLELDD